MTTILAHLWGLEKVMCISPSRVPFEESYPKIMGCIRRYNLPVTPRLSNNIISGKAPIRENSVAEPEGAPRPGRMRLVPKK